MQNSSSLLCSEYQVKELGHGVRLPKGISCPEKQSPDSACSMDYSNSRLSSPDHPGEGETHSNLNLHTHVSLTPIKKKNTHIPALFYLDVGVC